MFQAHLDFPRPSPGTSHFSWFLLVENGVSEARYAAGRAQSSAVVGSQALLVVRATGNVRVCVCVRVHASTCVHARTHHRDHASFLPFCMYNFLLQS